METKINISAILKDKPQETKLYDWLHNIDVELDTISTTDTETVVWCTNETNNNTTCHRGYSEFGTERGYPDGLQILFPSKEMRDWAKFSWKKGDVLISKDNVYIIFEEFEDDTYTRFKGKHYLWEECNVEYYDKEKTKILTSAFEKAADDVAQTYIKTIEERLGGKLNRETLEIEKSEFKDGDIIKMTWDKYSAMVIFWEYSNFGKGFDSHVFFNIKTKIIEYNIHGHILQDTILRLATEEEKKQLFSALEKEGKAWDAGKKMIIDLKQKVEFKPFDKVLCRNSKDDTWEADFFARLTRKEIDYTQSGKYLCVGDLWMYCIPYNEETAHLLGTTDEWKGGEQ